MNELTSIFFSSLPTSKVSRVYLFFQSDLDSIGAASVLLQLLEHAGIPTHHYCMEFPYKEAISTILKEIAIDKKGAVISLAPFQEEISKLLPANFMPSLYTLISSDGSQLKSLQKLERGVELIELTRSLLEEKKEIITTLAHHGYYRGGIDIVLKGLREGMGESYSLLADAEKSLVLKKTPSFSLKESGEIIPDNKPTELSARGYLQLLKRYIENIPQDERKPEYFSSFTPPLQIPGVFPPLKKIEELLFRPL